MAGEIVIDATNATLGRLASYATKQALQGKDVIILNSEKAIITGRKKSVLNHYHEKTQKKGSIQRGPTFRREPERILKRTIRGMIPDHRRGRGKEVFKKILCFRGVPEKYKEAKTIKAGKEKRTAFITVEELARLI